MNISKKAIMTFIVALTSVISMAQPYYHIMKEENGKLTEETGYNGKDYNIKISMEAPKPKDAIGDKITVPCSKRSFWFTNKGNVYYDKSKGRFFFEESQLDYPKGTLNKNHCGHFVFGGTIRIIVDKDNRFSDYSGKWDDLTEEYFYFNNPKNLPKLQEDLGNEKWTVLTSCEWEYVCRNFGEMWTIDGKKCYLIDTTSGKSLLRAIESKNGGKTITKEDVESYEDKGLVYLPASGDIGPYDGNSIRNQGNEGRYWSCTPTEDRFIQNYWYRNYAGMMIFANWNSGGISSCIRTERAAVRLVILAED